MEPRVEVDAPVFIKIEQQIGSDDVPAALQSLVDQGCTLVRLVETVDGNRTGRWMICEVRKPTEEEIIGGVTCMMAWPPVAMSNDCMIKE